MNASSSVPPPSASATAAGVPSPSSFSLVQHDHAIGDLGLLDQVRRPQHGRRARRDVGADGGEQIAPRLRIEPDGRLRPSAAPRADAAARARARPCADCRPTARAPRGRDRRLQTDRGAAAVDAVARQRAGQAVQIGVEAQVAAHRQIEIERHLLEHDADLAQRRHGLRCAANGRPRSPRRRRRRTAR